MKRISLFITLTLFFSSIQFSRASSPRILQSCPEDHFKDDDGLCRCFEGQYEDNSGLCQPCHASCATCSGGEYNQCITCGYSATTFINGECHCPNPKEYFNQDFSFCLPCSSQCASCNGMGEDNCLSCHSSANLVNNKCICPPGQYIDDKGECKPCDNTCNTCSGSSSYCLSCKGSASLSDFNSCACDSKSHKYLDYFTGECEECHEICKTCFVPGEFACSSCYPGYFFLNARCISPLLCQSNQYFNQKIGCIDCDPSCKTCSGGGNFNCSSCEAPYQLYTSVCKMPQTCLEDEYLDEYGDCQICHKSCKSCTGPNLDECTLCDQNRMLDLGQCFPILHPEGPDVEALEQSVLVIAICGGIIFVILSITLIYVSCKLSKLKKKIKKVFPVTHNQLPTSVPSQNGDLPEDYAKFLKQISS